MTTTTSHLAASVPTPAFARRSGRFWRELGYLLAGLPVGLVAFTVVVTGLSAGVSMLMLVVGVPLLAATLAAARAFAGWERRRVAAVTGWHHAPPRYAPRRGNDLGAMWRTLQDGQAWRDALHAVVSLPIRTVTFSLALTWTVGGLGELLYGAWSWSLPRDGDTGLLDLAFDIESRVADIAFHTGVGVLLLATAVPMVRGLTKLQAGVSHGLLNAAQ